MKSIAIAACAVVLTLAAVFVVKIPGFERRPIASSNVAGDIRPPKQLWTCGMHPQVIQDHPGNCPICHMKLVPLNMENQQSAGPTVRIDPTIVQNMGVRTAEVSRGPLVKTVRTVGMLVVRETADSEINLKVSGWIKKLYANQEGMHVHKGETLFDLYSPDLQVAEEELIGAVKALKSLDPKASELLRSQSQNLVDSARTKLLLWDVAASDVDAIANADKAPDTVPFRNPGEGHVMDKMVVDGSAVQAGMKIMRIEDHSKLWLEARVYQEDMSQIALGQTVEATVDAQPGKTYTGPITFIDPHVDDAGRTVLARITLDNPNHELSPGMYATANIITKPVADAVWVPREAVIDTGTQQIAFVVMAAGHFEPRKVRMGLVGDGDRVQILEGLAAGETVVTSGQFLLDVESRTAEAIAKLRGDTTTASSAAELMHPMDATTK
jgi:RND family efflux transporter MFP subunit